MNPIEIEDDIIYGERMAEFILKGNISEGWELIFEDSCIGHKFVNRWKGEEYTVLCLEIHQTTDTPLIKDGSI